MVCRGVLVITRWADIVDGTGAEMWRGVIILVDSDLCEGVGIVLRWNVVCIIHLGGRSVFTNVLGGFLLWDCNMALSRWCWDIGTGRENAMYYMSLRNKETKGY